MEFKQIIFRKVGTCKKSGKVPENPDPKQTFFSTKLRKNSLG